MRIAFLASHPIQYQAPLFRVLHQRPDVRFTALFCDDYGTRPSFDREFNKVIKYDVPLLDGYNYRFLRKIGGPTSRVARQLNPGIIPVLARGEFDAIIVHGYATPTAALAIGSPRRHTRLLMRGESNLLAPVGVLKQTAKNVILRALFRRIDHFLSIGSLNSKFYGAYGVSPARVTLAPYSVDNEFFATRAEVARNDPAAMRRLLGLPGAEVLFLFAGKLIAKKRPFDVLDAFANARITGRAGLVFVGDGDLYSELCARVAEYKLGGFVRVLGFRNQTELPSLFGACDALVLPSSFEPWGLVVNEAAASGAIALVSDQVGAAPDLVDRRCVFPVGDRDCLSRMLRTLVEDPALLAALRTDQSYRIRRWGLEQTADGVLRGVEAAFRLPARVV